MKIIGGSRARQAYPDVESQDFERAQVKSSRALVTLALEKNTLLLLALEPCSAWNCEEKRKKTLWRSMNPCLP